MKDVVAVFLGGGLGSVTRFLIGRWVQQQYPHHFPFGTLVVNVLACFALGAIMGYIAQKEFLSPVVKLFVAIGFCGGFSTFSTFSHESILLYQQQHYLSLVLYIAGSVLLCIAATVGGLYIVEKIN